MTFTTAGLNIGSSDTAEYMLDVKGDIRITSASLQYQENLDVDTGSEVIASIETGSFTSAFFDYTLSSGSNARAGTVMSVWNSTNVEYTEISTFDIGTTGDVIFDVSLSGSYINLNAVTATNDWTIKTLVRTL